MTERPYGYDLSSALSLWSEKGEQAARIAYSVIIQAVRDYERGLQDARDFFLSPAEKWREARSFWVGALAGRDPEPIDFNGVTMEKLICFIDAEGLNQFGGLR